MTDMWTLPVQWTGGVQQRWVFATEVFRSESGIESRVRQREFPREFLSEDYFVQPHTWSVEEKRLFDHPQTGHVDRLVRDYAVRAPMVRLSATQYDSSEAPWLRTGDRLIAYSGGTYAELTVFSSGYGEITTVEDLDTDDFLVGGSLRVYLARPSLAKKVQTTWASPRVGECKVDWELNPDRPRYIDEAETPTYRGFPLLSFRPGTGAQGDQTFDLDAERTDYGFGPPPVRESHGAPRPSWGYTLRAMNFEQAESIISFFRARKGMLEEFYFVDTGAMHLCGPLAEGDTEVSFQGAAHDGDYKQRNVGFWTGSGWILRGVSAREDPADGRRTILTLDQALPPGVDHIAGFRWVYQGRFTSDTLTARWRTSTVAEFSVGVTALAESFSEMEIAGSRISFGGFLVTFDAADSATEYKTTFGGDYVEISGKRL